MMSGENYQLIYQKKAWDEYQKLDGSQKIFVDKGLQRIKLFGMLTGQPLSDGLINCRKLKNRRMGLRIIFRQDNQKVEVIQILAIGKRSDKQVYRDAEQRLN